MMCASENTDCLFELSELEHTRTIGEGTSSIVYAGEWRGMDVAVKVLRGGLCARAEEEAESERSINSILRHPNIVPLLGSAGVPGGAHALVFEYCPGGTLDVRKLGYANAEQAIDVALDVARALEYAHSRGVIHRDIKPSQVLLGCCGRALLADWGLATQVGSSECTIGETGTWEYMAPEVINCQQPYGFAADVFSFGILLWTLLAGEAYPYEAEFLLPEQAAHAVARGDLRPRRLSRLSDAPALEDLMQLCWTHDPHERPTMTNVLDALLVIRDDLAEARNGAPSRHGGWGGWFWN